MPQQRVALAQTAVDIQPDTVKTMFHVEHAPVQELAPHLRPPFQQSEGVGIDQLQRQAPRQLGRTPDGLPLDPPDEAAVPIPRNTDGDRPRALFLAEQRGKHRALPGFMVDDGVEACRAKRTAGAEHEDRLQHAGLAAAIGAAQQVHAPQLELRLPYVPELADAQPPNRHALVVRLKAASA